MRILLLLLALPACDRAQPPAQVAGDRLEAAAQASGLVADPRGSLVGAWARETDRVCIVPAGGETRIGALVDYGDGNACAASGTLQRSGNRVNVRFGECRFDAQFDGERLSFPAELPAGCQSACTGRASMAALSVARLGSSVSEATTLRSPAGKLLCAN